MNNIFDYWGNTYWGNTYWGNTYWSGIIGPIFRRIIRSRSTIFSPIISAGKIFEILAVTGTLKITEKSDSIVSTIVESDSIVNLVIESNNSELEET